MSTGLRAGTNNDGYLQVNGTDVLTALSSGKIGIGTTPDWASATSTGIELNPATATNWIGIKNSSGSTTTNTAFQINHGLNVTTSILNSGAATFKGALRVDHSNNAGSDKLLRLGNANNSGTNSAHLFTAGSYFAGPTDVDGTGYKAKIDAGTGAAEFAGEVKVEGSSTPAGLSSRISRYGSLLIGTTSEAVGDARVSIDSGNGNGTFTGTIQSGGDPWSGVNNGAKLYPDGAFALSNSTGSTALVNLFHSNSTPTVTITAAGAATFRGNLEQGDTSTTAGGTLISDGTVYCRMDGSRPAAAKALVIYPSNTFSGSGNASIGADGVATFAGSVYAGNRTVVDHTVQGATLTPGGLYITRTPNDTPIALYQTGDSSAKFSVDTSGNMSMTGKITLKNSSGIQFGTSNTGTNITSQTLDDYEEGTWTPNIGGSAAYDIQWGYYIKIGRSVQLWGGLRPQSMGTGDARKILGLPFTAINSPSATMTGGGAITWCDNSATSFYNTPAIAIDQSSTTARITMKNGSSVILQSSFDFWQNNHRANFFITYWTND